MGHISSIGAGLYSDLSIAVDSVLNLATAPTDSAGWQALFANEVANGSAVGGPTYEYRRIKNVREFPQMGVPPNIVNVPTYGSKTSRQVQGQADSPTFEVTLNFVPLDWQKTANYLGNLVGDGNPYAFRFVLLATEPASYASTSGGLGTALAGGACQNSQYFWGGKLEALQVNPQLTDANTAVLTISIQTDFYGAYTTT